MKYIRLIVIAVILIVLATSASHALPMNEDVTYWFKTANGGTDSSPLNPGDDWVKANTASLLVKIQETVYDKTSTAAILSRNGIAVPTGFDFLYAYSITNINLGDVADPTNMGIKRFQVDWAAPFVSAVSPQTPAGWSIDTAPTGPSWKWNLTAPGILPGDTVGGFWAVSNVDVDGELTATLHVGGFGEPQGFAGRTTGPLVPEPATFVSLFVGIAGLGLTRRLRRK